MLTKTVVCLIAALAPCLFLLANHDESSRIELRQTSAVDSFEYAYWIDSADGSIKQAINADEHRMFTIYKGSYPFYLGYLTKTCWVRACIHNPKLIPQTIYWNIYDDIDTLSLFETSDSGIIIKEHPYTSVQIPIQEREVKVRSLSFEIYLEPNETKILYLRIVNKGDILHMPMSLTTSDEYYQSELTFNIIYSLFFGIFCFAVVANLLLWFFLRDSVYLWYGGYVLMIMLFLAMDAYLESYLLPFWLFKAVNAAGRLVIIFLTLSIQTGMGRRLMGLTPQNSRLYKITNIMVGVLLICALVTLPINLFRYQIPMEIQMVLYSIAVFASGLAIATYFVVIGEQILKRNKFAVYYAGSCLFLIVCALNYYLQQFNLSATFLFKNNGMAIGLTLEVLALAALVAYRLNLLNHEKLVLAKENALKHEQLTLAVLQAHEDEQVSIGRNLHDGPLSYLIALRMLVNQKLYSLKKMRGADEATETLTEIQVRLDKSIRDVRDVSHHLMPQEFETNKLTEIIQNHLQTVEKSGEVRFEFMAAEEVNALPKSMQLHLFHIVSELVSNILRHSQASEAIIQFLMSDNKIQLMVDDDGKGIKAGIPSPGIGLKSIHTRVQILNGKITIDSNKMGTVIIIEIPLHEKL